MGISLKADLTDLDRIQSVVEAKIKQIHDETETAAQAVAQRITDRVRADIKGAGHFGSNWTDAFKVNVTANDPSTITLQGSMENAPPYWRVFQYGATIQGKPFLWFTPTKPMADKAGFALSKTPTVISVRKVVIPKKFHITEIIEEEAALAGATVKQLLG